MSWPKLVKVEQDEGDAVMKEKPIIFSGPMVRAILEGRKTQTRRVVKWQPDDALSNRIADGAFWSIDGKFWTWNGTNPPDPKTIKCPYPPGTVLWVKETHYRYGKWVKNGVTKTGRQKWKFRATTDEIRYQDNPPDTVCKKSYRGEGWYKRPLIFMPLSACRLHLLVTAVRVERLQDITEEDAEAEGVNHIDDDFKQDAARSALACGSVRCTARDYFRILWDSLNAKFGYGWDTNPWVWVYTFKAVS